MKYHSLILATLLLASTSSYAQTVLTYIDHESYGNMRTKVIYDEFFREVEKQSRGNIKIHAI